MNQSDKEAFLELARGAAFAGAVMTGLLFFVAFFGTFNEKPREKFKVVDHYGTCAIVRYTDPSQQWHYFLDCGNEHLEEKGG